MIAFSVLLGSPAISCAHRIFSQFESSLLSQLHTLTVFHVVWQFMREKILNCPLQATVMLRNVVKSLTRQASLVKSFYQNWKTRIRKRLLSFVESFGQSLQIRQLDHSTDPRQCLHSRKSDQISLLDETTGKEYC